MLKSLRQIDTFFFFGTIVASYILISNLQRLIFTLWVTLGRHESISHLEISLAKGLLFDLGVLFFILITALLWFLIVPKRFVQKLWFRIPLFIFLFLPLAVSSTAALCEFFFFDEFHARYNFIAVDYLVYTNEVAHNILETFPWYVVATTFLLPSILVFFGLRFLFRRLERPPMPRPKLIKLLTGVLAMALCAGLVSEDSLLASDTYWTREVSKNTMFALFSAYRKNSINFHQFYASLPATTAFETTAKWLNSPDGEKSSRLVRQIQPDGPEKDWNVVMVVMESLSAGFMNHFGNPILITPNLDKLADQGLFLTNFYATGTRTVRGLEALTLSLPPTPGQSILRRPNSDHLFNLGQVFRDHGYKTQFLYGGYAYFDNMKDWYQGNGFEVVDHAEFPSEEIHFSNAWGVCDEDLFDQVLKQQEKITTDGKHFFQMVMTTSNHRPYTFPEGRIDILPHTGREGAIKYSDFAIGRFVEMAKTKPWFKNTLFIFVADHDASVAGGTDIPIKDYLIPAIFYNPELIKPGKITKLASQIDMAPTLLGLLNFSYPSQFYGQDLNRTDRNYALLGTYQKVALLQDHTLTILAPGHTVETQELNEKYAVIKTSRIVSKDASLLPDAGKLTISIYQTASELFQEGLLKVKPAGDNVNPN